MSAVPALAEVVGVQAACAALSVPRATFYRHRSRQDEPNGESRPRPPLALTTSEREEVLDVLHSDRFVDHSPRQVWAALLDEDQRYLCSVRTMYRVLESEGELQERRRQKRHPSYEKPELLATRPNELWSWDITKLKGPAKWTSYYLYVILDVFSRYIVGWMLASRESGTLAKRLIAETVAKQEAEEQELTLHSDRGPSMTSKPVALLLADLGVTRSLNRPYTSNDNPFSEAQFKTLKYHPSFPDRFGSLEDARVFCRSFMSWYNTRHYHTGLGLMTPEAVHYGRADDVLRQRRKILNAASQAHPRRFKRRSPALPELPEQVWINPPRQAENAASATQQTVPQNDLKRCNAATTGQSSTSSPARPGCRQALPEAQANPH